MKSRFALAFTFATVGCNASPTPPAPFVFPEIADRTSNAGASAAISIGATLNGSPSGYASDLDALARSARIVTFPDLTPVDVSVVREEIPPQEGAAAEFRIVLTPTAPLTNRWYAIEMPPRTPTIDVQTNAGSVTGSNGHRYVRFRPDSFPVAREVLLPQGRDSQTIYIQFSEPVRGVGGAIAVDGPSGPVRCAWVPNAASVSGSPFTWALECDAIALAAPLTVRFAEVLESPSTGMMVQNVGTNGHPSEFVFVPAELEQRGNVPTFVFPD